MSTYVSSWEVRGSSMRLNEKKARGNGLSVQEKSHCEIILDDLIENRSGLSDERIYHMVKSCVKGRITQIWVNTEHGPRCVRLEWTAEVAGDRGYENGVMEYGPFLTQEEAEEAKEEGARECRAHFSYALIRRNGQVHPDYGTQTCEDCNSKVPCPQCEEHMINGGDCKGKRGFDPKAPIV